jgi:AraC-like DNA-binding protein
MAHVGFDRASIPQFPSGLPVPVRALKDSVGIQETRDAKSVLSVCELNNGGRLSAPDDHGTYYLLYMGLKGSIELNHGQKVDRIPPRKIVLRLVDEGFSLAAKEPVRGLVAFIPSKHFRQTENVLLTLIHEAVSDGPLGPRMEEEAGTPWYITMAEKFMEDRVAEPISMRRLAEVTGMNPRTLHEGFRKHRGHSPMKLLRELRMGKVKQELSEPGENTTVTDAALKWGFCHLSRFSAYYSARFGEKPSDTLLRARTRMRRTISRSQFHTTTPAIRLAASSSTV